MLVDTGSSSDILYLNTFDKLQLPHSHIQPIDDPSYNGLIGRPTLTAIRAIVSPLHLKLKFPTAGGIGEMCGNQKRARICYQASVPPVNKPMVESRKKHGRESQLKIRTVRKEEEEDISPKKRKFEMTSTTRRSGINPIQPYKC
ncbi:hypothetical protein LIER_32790 [Lithospermum erythrorhizon]|uniref:Uncharacterized protein n=1 Tax=Lithospermum erythrorhizon TaxID=34254 RepID=A0AAV3RYQ5_LITER